MGITVFTTFPIYLSKITMICAETLMNLEVRAVPNVYRTVNLIDLVESFPMSVWLRSLASIAKRASPLKFPKGELQLES